MISYACTLVRHTKNSVKPTHLNSTHPWACKLVHANLSMQILADIESQKFCGVVKTVQDEKRKKKGEVGSFYTCLIILKMINIDEIWPECNSAFYEKCKASKLSCCIGVTFRTSASLLLQPGSLARVPRWDLASAVCFSEIPLVHFWSHWFLRMINFQFWKMPNLWPEWPSP